MAFSLYAATIPSYQQILGSVSGLLVKAEAFCAEKSINHDEIIQARLAPDMLPFAYQVKSTTVHSLGAIEGLRRGTFSPDMTPPPETLRHSRYGPRRRLVRSKKLSRPRSIPSSGVICASSAVSIASTSRPRISSCHSHSRISTFTPPRPTGFCAGRACRSASEISRAGFA